MSGSSRPSASPCPNTAPTGLPVPHVATLVLGASPITTAAWENPAEMDPIPEPVSDSTL